jgi:hypothetical protein
MSLSGLTPVDSAMIFHQLSGFDDLTSLRGRHTRAVQKGLKMQGQKFGS